MRFNPPPNWPITEGFTPGTGWQPLEAWGPAPVGWPLWLPDERGRGSWVKPVGIAAAVVLAVGVLLAFLPVKSHGVKCGTAFSKSNDALTADFSRAFQADALGMSLDGGVSDIEDACDDARSARLPLALVPLIVGGAGVLAAVSMAGSGRPSQGGAAKVGTTA